MGYHIIVKKEEFKVALRLEQVFRGFKFFGVHEVGEHSGDHWHFWTDCDWNNAKLRREIDRVRDERVHGVSIRSWDDNLVYFCKGAAPGSKPDIIANNCLSSEQIDLLHDQWWTKCYNKPSDNPDLKLPTILDELVELVRGKDVTEMEVTSLMIGLFKSRGGHKMTSIKSTGQAYIRTAMLFTMHAKRYEKKLHEYYSGNLYLSEFN